ncbi:hypothetical protein DFH06DRAFT_988910 [Mycena polygramma]|nr:hypothetical protein DFH06DRAFT_988910 [Mycena polygramma]
MHFTLSPHNPINASYTETETGVEWYRVKTDIKVHDSVTTIGRRIDGDVPQHNSDSEAPEDERFGHLAQISWRVVGPNVIHFGGQELDATAFFQHRGFGLFGWELGFTARDGKKYRWCKHINRTTLEVDDDAAAPVVEYQGLSRGILGKAKEPSLEIFPPFEHMADEIVVTFIYVEKTRKS